MAALEQLGHIGLNVVDLALMRRFYEDTVGLTVTDDVPERGLVFLSCRPEEEHHELLLFQSEHATAIGTRLNQVSFRCPDLASVQEHWRNLVEHDVPIRMTVSHGNAVGVYFSDPEGNTVEVYWATGLHARQPFMETVDLSLPTDEVWSQVAHRVAEYGDVGFLGHGFERPRSS